MADNVENIDFSGTYNGVSGTGQSDTFKVSGPLAVDYTTMTTSGIITVKTNETTETYTNPSIIVSNGIYTISNSGDTDPLNNSFSVQYQGQQPMTGNVTFFQEGAISGTRGAAIKSSPACFCTNTLIRTVRGDVAVQDLRVGDLAITASGNVRPIRWIGHRYIASSGQALAFSQQPIRVLAGAFGRNLPERDLRLSPGHPVLVGADENNLNGVLVPIMCLVNGTTIQRVPVQNVTYWHVELDEHDILLAEGLSAESYLDWGDRAFFTEASDHALMDPDLVVPGLAGRCRAVAVDGPIVEAERLRLDTIFAVRLDAAGDWPSDHIELAF